MCVLIVFMSASPGYFSNMSIYYSVKSSRSQILLLSNNAGYSRILSQAITPSTPVSSMHLYMSSNFAMPPLHITGIDRLCLIFLMMSQLQEPTKCLLCSLHLPWTVSNDAPASQIAFASSRVRSSSGRQRILHVTGTLRFQWSVETMEHIRSFCSSRNEP